MFISGILHERHILIDNLIDACNLPIVENINTTNPKNIGIEYPILQSKVYFINNITNKSFVYQIIKYQYLHRSMSTLSRLIIICLFE